MKQIYDFEQNSPPVLNENMLRNELKKKKLNTQTLLLVIAGILMQFVLILLGLSAFDWYPWITVLSFGYVVISVTGGGIIAVTYIRKGGIHL